MTQPGTGGDPNATTGGGTNPGYVGSYTEQAFRTDFLIRIINDATVSAKNKLQILQARRSAVSIADMFDMQMLMNRLSQLSETVTSVMSAMQTSMMSIARAVKG